VITEQELVTDSNGIYCKCEFKRNLNRKECRWE